MDILRLVLSFIAATAVGWNILFWFVKRDISFSVLEKLALSYITGLGALTLQMFFYSLAGIKFSLFTLLLPHAALTVVTGFIFMNSMPTGSMPPVIKMRNSILFYLPGYYFRSYTRSLRRSSGRWIRLIL